MHPVFFGVIKSLHYGMCKRKAGHIYLALLLLADPTILEENQLHPIISMSSNPPLSILSKDAVMDFYRRLFKNFVCPATSSETSIKVNIISISSSKSPTSVCKCKYRQVQYITIYVYFSTSYYSHGSSI